MEYNSGSHIKMQQRSKVVNARGNKSVDVVA